MENRSHCVKYARIRVFSDPYFPVLRQNRRFCLYTGKYATEETRAMAYFTGCLLLLFFTVYYESKLPDSTMVPQLQIQ